MGEQSYQSCSRIEIQALVMPTPHGWGFEWTLISAESLCGGPSLAVQKLCLQRPKHPVDLERGPSPVHVFQSITPGREIPRHGLQLLPALFINALGRTNLTAALDRPKGLGIQLCRHRADSERWVCRHGALPVPPDEQV